MGIRRMITQQRYCFVSKRHLNKLRNLKYCSDIRSLTKGLVHSLVVSRGIPKMVKIKGHRVLPVSLPGVLPNSKSWASYSELEVKLLVRARSRCTNMYTALFIHIDNRLSKLNILLAVSLLINFSSTCNYRSKFDSWNHFWLWNDEAAT